MSKKMILLTLAASLLFTPITVSAETDNDENIDFVLEQSEKNSDSDSKHDRVMPGKATPDKVTSGKVTPTPTPTYKPIIGQQVTVVNEEAAAQHKKLEKKISKEKKILKKIKRSISKTKKELAKAEKNPAKSALNNSQKTRELGRITEYSLEEYSYSKNIVKSRIRKLKKTSLPEAVITFDPNDVTKKSHITTSLMKKILEGTRLQQFADTYVQIEEKYGINAIFICSISALESGWGTSRRARETNNYTGFGVYTDDSVGINADSGEENLLMTAKQIAKNYVTPGSLYYNGTGIDDINLSYAASRTWGFKVEAIGLRLMEKLA